MSEIQPWFDEDGFKLMDDDNRPFDCDRCPCICAICDAFGSDSSEWPEGFQRGVRFEVYGVPCSGECGDDPQTFEVDYSEYAASHPGWETCAWRVRDDESPCWHWYVVMPQCEIYEWAYIRDCCPTCYEHSEDPCFETGYRWEVTGIPCGGTCADAPQTFSIDYSWYHDLHTDWYTCKWCERDGNCIHYYTVDPECNVVEWATLLDCESSSSGSSSSGSSSSLSSSSSSSSSSQPVEGWYCQTVRRVWQFGSLYLPPMPCGITPSQAMSYYTLEQLQDLCLAGRGQVEYTYNAYRLDADGNVVEGHVEQDTETGSGSSSKLWITNIGCYNAEGELSYGSDCDHCMWQAGLDNGWDDFDVTAVLSTRRVGGPGECGAEPDPAEMAVPDEDDLI